jgi:hypothetical protein
MIARRLPAWRMDVLGAKIVDGPEDNLPTDGLRSEIINVYRK